MGNRLHCRFLVCFVCLAVIALSLIKRIMPVDSMFISNINTWKSIEQGMESSLYYFKIQFLSWIGHAIAAFSLIPAKSRLNSQTNMA